MADGHEVTTENRDVLRDRALPAAPAVRESRVYRKNVTSFARSAKKGELVVTELRGKEETRQTAYRSVAISPSSQLKRTLHFEPASRRAAPVGLSRLRPLLGTAQPHLAVKAPPKARDQLGVGVRSKSKSSIPGIWHVKHAGLPGRPDDFPLLRTSHVVFARADVISKRISEYLQSRSIKIKFSKSDDGNNVVKCRNKDFCKFTIGLYAAEDDGVLVVVDWLCGDCISFRKDCRAILNASEGKTGPIPSGEQLLHPRLPISNGPPQSNQQGEKIENLTSKMEEPSTSNENGALLNEEISMSSSEWLPNNDVERANWVHNIPPNVFDIDSHPSPSGSGDVASPPECQAATADLSQNSTWSKLMQLSSSRDIPMKNSFATHPQSKSNPETKTCVVTLSTSPCSSSTPPKTSTGKKKKKRRERQHDMTRAVEVTDNDILFGRGGETNKHPGNVYFRERVLEWLQQYMQSSKEEKEEIAKVLLESFELEGRRFLEQIGDGGLYYKVVRGQHIKVSAALRDLKKKHKKEIEI